MTGFLRFYILLIFNSVCFAASSTKSGNHLRVALDGLQDSNPSQIRRQSPRADGVYHSVYDKGPVLPGAGVRTQYFFVGEDYTVFDGARNRVVPFFDPEILINCNCDQPFPPELDIPHRFAVYNPVTVQAPLPDVPKDLGVVKYTGYYYACPGSTNPFEFAWYNNRQRVNPCKWMWYQSVQDSIDNSANLTQGPQ